MPSIKIKLFKPSKENIPRSPMWPAQTFRINCMQHEPDDAMAELCYRVTQPGERHRVESSLAYLSLVGHANNTKNIIKSPSDKAAQYPGQRRRIQTQSMQENRGESLFALQNFANSAFRWCARAMLIIGSASSAATCAWSFRCWRAHNHGV